MCSIIGLFGMISKKGSTTESSLLFAYIVRCIYETFPELSNLASAEIEKLIKTTTSELKQESLKHFSNSISINYNLFLTNIFKTLTLNIPKSFQTIIEFLILSSKIITPKILINLAFRVAVFYSATRIIPALKSTQSSTRFMKLIYAFSPCIVIAIYTHLMMQYANELDSKMCIWGAEILDRLMMKEQLGDCLITVHPWQFWNWINMFSTLIIYSLELVQ